METEVVTLRAGDLEARFVPSVGMVGASLRHAGRELLGQRGGIEAYRARGSSFGIPLLHPWANRLGGFAYAVDGVAATLDAGMAGLRTEEHGLPIHGLLAAYPRWTVTARDGRRLSAEADLGADPAVMAGFPFAHRLALDVALTADALTLTATLTPTGDRAVPICFGLHPYLTVPDTARADLVLRHGPLTRLAADERGLPTGRREPTRARDGPLGEATYDDLYTDLGPERAVTLGGARREVTVRLLEGFTHLQLFAPPGSGSVAIEPMTAPTDALRTGDGLRLVAPGRSFAATFAIAVRAQPRP